MILMMLLGVFGLEGDDYSWRLHFSDYHLNSNLLVEELVDGRDPNSNITGFAKLPICPVQLGANVGLVGIFLVEYNVPEKEMDLYVDGPSDVKVVRNVGERYGEDFFLVASDSLSCETDRCLVSIFRGADPQCLIDEYGNIIKEQ